jgi:hypothetical protein
MTQLFSAFTHEDNYCNTQFLRNPANFYSIPQLFHNICNLPEDYGQNDKSVEKQTNYDRHKIEPKLTRHHRKIVHFENLTSDEEKNSNWGPKKLEI